MRITNPELRNLKINQEKTWKTIKEHIETGKKLIQKRISLIWIMLRKWRGKNQSSYMGKKIM